MTKEIQDRTWASLPKEVRSEIKAEYQNAIEGSDLESFLQDFFGHHNLTSDTEPEEMLMVERKKVRCLYASTQKIVAPTSKSFIEGKLQAYYELFGDKCLPDKEAEQPKPKKFFESDHSIGDKVIVCISSIGEPRKEVVTLRCHYQPQCEYNDYAKTWVIQTQDGRTFQSNEEYFESYTEENKE